LNERTLTLRQIVAELPSGVDCIIVIDVKLAKEWKEELKTLREVGMMTHVRNIQIQGFVKE
jgi:hypothetical protein